MHLQIKVDTHVLRNGFIEQVVTGPGIDKFDVRQVIMRQVIDTLDNQARAALIQLGWTPPPQYRHIVADDSEGGLI